tara:strand:- start:72 stop:524 length:453 start_codon:yes stop_codon:yes gene_type:complete
VGRTIERGAVGSVWVLIVVVVIVTGISLLVAVVIVLRGVVDQGAVVRFVVDAIVVVIGVDTVGLFVAIGVVEAFVGLSIAIIVETITDLLTGSFQGVTFLYDPVHAAIDRMLTGSQSTGGRTQIFIDFAIAVVVEEIADLVCGFLRAAFR